MKYILITGGAGFIPSSLASRLLLDENNFLVLVDNLLTGKLSNIPNSNRCTFYNLDVNDHDLIKNIIYKYNFDYIFHYAAVVGVKRTIENPILVLNDIDGIKNILSLSVKRKIKKVFFSSSSEVYGEPVEIPMNETTTPLNSRLPYAIVKNIGEAYFKSFYKEYGLDYTIFRFFNTYGIKQSDDFVLSRFLQAAIKNEDITIYGDGNQSRTFCYIDDNIDLTINCFEKNIFTNDVINVGSDIIYTIKELADLIIKLLDSKSKIIYLPKLEEGDMFRRQPDISKMKQIINHPLVTLEDGILKIIRSL